MKEHHVVDIACGSDYTVALTGIMHLTQLEKGAVYSWGSPQYGQLGHGSDEQHIKKAGKIVFEPRIVLVDDQNFLVKLLDLKDLIQFPSLLELIMLVLQMTRALFMLGGRVSSLSKDAQGTVDQA